MDLTCNLLTPSAVGQPSVGGCVGWPSGRQVGDDVDLELQGTDATGGGGAGGQGLGEVLPVQPVVLIAVGDVAQVGAHLDHVVHRGARRGQDPLHVGHGAIHLPGEVVLD